jgi:hypothetical protein
VLPLDRVAPARHQFLSLPNILSQITNRSPTIAFMRNAVADLSAEMVPDPILRGAYL